MCRCCVVLCVVCACHYLCCCFLFFFSLSNFSCVQQLEERRSSKADELEQTKSSFKSTNTKLTSATKDLARLQAQEKSVQSQFAGVLAENQKLEKILTKIYKKKVVRQKQRTGDDSDDDEDDESEELSEDGSDAGSSDDDEIDETVCPPGCDQAVYEKVMRLREMRADVEEQLAEVKKSVETLKKDMDSFTKKEKSTQVGERVGRGRSLEQRP